MYDTYNASIPMQDRETALLYGTCLQKITLTFPYYLLVSVADDIHQSYKSAIGDASNLPKLASSVGGNARYHPKIIFQLLSGLAIQLCFRKC